MKLVADQQVYARLWAQSYSMRELLTPRGKRVTTTFDEFFETLWEWRESARDMAQILEGEAP